MSEQNEKTPVATVEANPFQAFKSAKPTGRTGNQLKAKDDKTPLRYEDLVIVKVAFTDDWISNVNDPKIKDKLPEWKDRTKQMFVTFMDNKSKGIVSRRFNAFGFMKYKDIPEDQRQGLIPLGEDGYAVQESTMTRIRSKANTAICVDIVNQLMEACGLPEGSEPVDLLKCHVSGEVSVKQYGDKEYFNVGAFSRIKAKEVPDLSAQIAEQVESAEENY